VLYDWAWGAFTTIVATFVFPAYFTKAVAADPTSGAAQWAGMQAAAGLLIAVLAVPLGAVADRGGGRRLMMAAGTGIMVAATLALWTVHPNPADIPRALVLVLTATVAFEVATVFYNAMLPGLVRPERLGRLSMLAWGAGYAGGLCCLGLCLVLLISPDPSPFGLDRARMEHVRAAPLLAGAWIAVFAWPCAVFVPEPARRTKWRDAVREGARELRQVLHDALADPPLRTFLIARLLYMDGLITLFAFGGIYAAGEFGMDAKDVLLFGIGLNVSAGLGALVFAFIEDRIGPKATALAAVVLLAAIVMALLFVYDRTLFWALGLAGGLFVGPAQAASRSLMARMAPSGSHAGYFGLFALSGRVTGFAGPLFLGVGTAMFHSQRAGMAVVAVLLAAGAAFLTRVPSPALQLRAASQQDDVEQPDELGHEHQGNE
jgi:UMF1 family MFS transporter